MPTYRTFRRTCRNWKQFASARKLTEERGLTEAEAHRFCRNANAGRSKSQIARGTVYEYEQE
jgi:hypothetical protein